MGRVIFTGANLIDGDHPAHLPLSCARIHIHHDDVTAERIGHVRGVVIVDTLQTWFQTRYFRFCLLEFDQHYYRSAHLF